MPNPKKDQIWKPKSGEGVAARVTSYRQGRVKVMLGDEKKDWAVSTLRKNYTLDDRSLEQVRRDEDAKAAEARRGSVPPRSTPRSTVIAPTPTAGASGGGVTVHTGYYIPPPEATVDPDDKPIHWPLYALAAIFVAGLLLYLLWL